MSSDDLGELGLSTGTEGGRAPCPGAHPLCSASGSTKEVLPNVSKASAPHPLHCIPASSPDFHTSINTQRPGANERKWAGAPKSLLTCDGPFFPPLHFGPLAPTTPALMLRSGVAKRCFLEGRAFPKDDTRRLRMERSPAKLEGPLLAPSRDSYSPEGNDSTLVISQRGTWAGQMQLLKACSLQIYRVVQK